MFVKEIKKQTRKNEKSVYIIQICVCVSVFTCVSVGVCVCVRFMSPFRAQCVILHV